MITLATVVWEKNFESLLKGGWFLDYRHDMVKEKIVIVNNVKNLEALKTLAESARVRLVYSDDHKDIALKLGIDEKSPEYYYTVQYPVLYKVATQPYVFLVQDDCEVHFKEDFFTDSINEFELNEAVVVTTLSSLKEPNTGIREEQIDRVTEVSNNVIKDMPRSFKFYYGFHFSDQLFFAKVDRIKNVPMDEKNIYTDFFHPKYGNSYEKRLCAYFVNKGKCRAVYRDHYYLHQPK